ncbi:3-isopropylmalate dehydratase small subunit [bacterium F11]|nr:3-isopropylmalate dehydratase small subunit [bacterium F11]
MQRFTQHKGLTATLDRQHVDTDQIIPKQFLKRIERTGFGQFLFYDWRYLEDGKTPNPSFELNAPRFRGASILITRDNFGCGSSREHAPWAILEYGFRALIAPSFADIFYNNCFKNGILPVVLDGKTVGRLFEEIKEKEGYQLEVDLEKQILKTPSGEAISFDINPFRKHCLLNGLDDIGLTLQQEKKITTYESTHPIT